jgi:alpha-ketoglutarate-dependent taurine dioxygenase
MAERNAGKFDPSQFRRTDRKVVKISDDDLVRIDYLDSETKFPAVIEPKEPDINLAVWAESKREFLQQKLLEGGAILFRGFKVDDAAQFERFACAVSGELIDYRERAAPRHEVRPRVYTSTELPADQLIPLHHEMSYSHNWPTKIWFYCEQPPFEGGRTPIADDRRIFNLLDSKIKSRFLEKGLMYVRNYGEGLDLSWQAAFQTLERSVVEEYCRKAGTQFEWRADDRLRTRQHRQVVVRHPKTGDQIWFNHAHMFHLSNLPTEIRDALLSEFKEDEIPRNAFYGDGSAIETSILDEIRDLYQRNAAVFSWQKADVLMLDNFLASHGREPFIGPRKILVAMAELYHNEPIRVR